MKEVKLRVIGEVQGVGFRYHTQRMAVSLGVKGWIRNLHDGDVEILAQGTDEQVNAFIQWCYKGPPAAQVARVKIENRPCSQTLSQFTIAETA